jgi:peptidoglycan/LPS O-acetylase OafA/YrhL
VVGQIFSAGNNGVELFFVISGFILGLPFATQYIARGKKIRLKDYFIRRLTRIEPPYVIQLALVFIWVALVLHRSPAQQHNYGSEGWLRYTVPHMLASLFYAHHLIYNSHPYPNIVLWSLEIEVQFYILAPFLAALFAIRNPWWRRALIVTLIVAWPGLIALLGLAPYTSRVGLLGELPNFLAGFFLVEIYLAGWLTTAKKNFLWDIAFLICIPALVYFPLLPWIYFLVLCIAAFRGQIACWCMSNPWITTIGGMCYSIYMYHWLMISVFIRGTIHLRTGILWLDLLMQFVVLAPMIYFACSFLFAWFERPFMRRDWPARFKQFLLRTEAVTPIQADTAKGE